MKTSVLPLLACCFVLSSCALGAAAGVGTAVGVAAVQEGGLERAGSDAWIQAQINDLWLQHDFEMFRKLDMTVNQGRVLLTGVVQNPEHRVEAVRLAWQPSGVKSVINEIKVADSEGIMGYANDTWITTKIRSILLADSEIESLNYSIDTVQGTVYLMGFAQDQQELDRAIGKSRTVSGVKRVVSYVKLVGAPEGPENLPPAYGQNQQNTRPGYNDSGYNGSSVNGYGYNNSGYNGSGSDDTAQGAAVPSVADGEPIKWSQESIY